MNKLFEYADNILLVQNGNVPGWPQGMGGIDSCSYMHRFNHYWNPTDMPRFLAQTFTPRVNFTLTAIDLPLVAYLDARPNLPWTRYYDPPTATAGYWWEKPHCDFTINLETTVDGAPSGTVLASATINTADLPLYFRFFLTGEDSWYTDVAYVWTWIPMSVELEKDVTYAITLKTYAYNFGEQGPDFGEWFAAGQPAPFTHSTATSGVEPAETNWDSYATMCASNGYWPAFNVPGWIASSSVYERGSGFGSGGWDGAPYYAPSVPYGTYEDPTWHPSGTRAFRTYGYAAVGPVAGELDLHSSSDLSWQINEKELYNDLRLYILPDFAAYGVNQDSINRFGRRTKVLKYALSDNYSVGLAIDAVKTYQEPKHEVKATMLGTTEAKIKKILGTKVADWDYIHYDDIGLLDLAKVGAVELSVSVANPVLKCVLNFLGTTALEILTDDYFQVDIDRIDGAKVLGE